MAFLIADTLIIAANAIDITTSAITATLESTVLAFELSFVLHLLLDFIKLFILFIVQLLNTTSDASNFSNIPASSSPASNVAMAIR